ncbi:hypothetical protein AUQ48_14490 [Kocuria flava]|uniref:Uncharacterized protein n=1 Tax=Kocuria flava TaxID=446860 RepID=A0A2N4T4Q1_9MICC|nr:hypothetical protein AUQ48_14490 [Kocuria flava]
MPATTAPAAFAARGSRVLPCVQAGRQASARPLPGADVRGLFWCIRSPIPPLLTAPAVFPDGRWQRDAVPGTAAGDHVRELRPDESHRGRTALHMHHLRP